MGSDRPTRVAQALAGTCMQAQVASPGPSSHPSSAWALFFLPLIMAQVFGPRVRGGSAWSNGAEYSIGLIIRSASLPTMIRRDLRYLQCDFQHWLRIKWLGVFWEVEHMLETNYNRSLMRIWIALSLFQARLEADPAGTKTVAIEGSSCGFLRENKRGREKNREKGKSSSCGLFLGYF